MILANTRGRAGDFSGVGVRSSNPSCGEFKVVDDIGGDIVVNVGGLIDELVVFCQQSLTFFSDRISKA